MENKNPIYIFFFGLLLLALIIAFAWAIPQDKKKREKNFLECVQATECYRCISISDERGMTAETCGFEPSPYFQELDIDNIQWCYEKFIK